MEPTLIVLAAVVVIAIALTGFISVRSRPRRGPSGQVEAPERPPEEVVEQPPDARAPLPEAPPAPGPPKTPPMDPESTPTVAPPSTAPVPAAVDALQALPAESAPAEAPPRVSRLSRGLSKTRGALGRTLGVLTGADRLDEEDWDDVEAALLSADVGVKVTERIIESLKSSRPTPSTLSDALASRLLATFADRDRTLKTERGAGPAVWLVTGVNGVGKTTTIAKLAHRMRSQGHTVVLAAGDTFRAAAIDQLGTWAERVGVHMVRHAPGADPSAVVFDAIEHGRAKGVDLVIADTAGRLHTKSNLMDELKKVHRIADQQAGGVAEVLLVLDATVGQNGIAQAKTFKEAVGVTGLVLAKLDGSAKGGVALAVEEELGIPVKLVGVGEGLDDLETFDPRQFVEALVQER